MIQCERGHFFDENRYSNCPYCSQVSSQPRSVTPPVAPNMQIPTPSCGKTVSIPGMEPESPVGKTVAIDGFVENPSPVNKTVAIEEPPLDFPPVTPIAAPVQSAAAPVQSVSAPAQPVAAPVQPVSAPVQPVAAPVVAAAPEVTPAAIAPAVSPVPVAVPEVSVPDLSNLANEPVPAQNLEEVPSFSLPVTGLGVTEHPAPLAQEEKFYHSSPDRPYAVTGLGVKEHPTPIPNDVGATFPLPSEGGAEAAAAPSMQSEASAFAAFGFPGGPVPGMGPGGPRPGVQMQAPEAASDLSQVPADVPAATETPAPAPVEESAPVEASAPVEESAPVEVSAPVAAPVVENPAPRDPNATVALTESEMDYLPRIHARAFLVCIDGPMTGASYVFQESRAIIGRQKNYEIALYRDNSVSRSPHAIISYYKDTFRYTVSQGDADKKVSVNGSFISAETDLKLYDVIGIGQTRLLCIPVCSEKFAW